MKSAKARPEHLRVASEKFLERIVVEHGPVQTLARFFLKAATDLSALGFELRFIDPEQLVKANLENRDNWLPLVQTFDPQWSDLNPDNIVTVAIFREGRIVGVHSVRRFDWRDTNMHEEILSYRFLYADPVTQKRPEETVSITTSMAREITGVVGFSGAAWYHPDCRGLGLSRILPRLAKGIALTRWDVTRIVAIMSESVHRRGFAARFGYHGVDWDITFKKSRGGWPRVALLWMDRPNLESYVGEYLAGTQADIRVLNSGNENKPARVMKQR